MHEFHDFVMVFHILSVPLFQFYKQIEEKKSAAARNV